MDRRTGLRKNHLLEFIGKSGGKFMYTIEREIGRGNTCIVYEATYETNSGDRKLVRIKECYPFDLEVTRLDSGELFAAENSDKFEICKQKINEDFKLENELFHTDGLTDMLVNTFDIYHANNTVYIVFAYLKDNALSEYRPTTIKSCIRIVKNVAIAVGKIHEEGYLYLDAKPENILVVDSVSERILLFDLDTLIPISEIGSGLSLSYSRGYAAPELRSGKFRQIGFHTDVYGIGAVLFFLLFGRTPAAPDCENNAEYDFSEMNYSNVQYCDRLYFKLRNFFHKTLANYYPDRFANMSETINALEEIEKYSDIAEPYIISSQINRPVFFVGRERELALLDNENKNSDRNYIFVNGIGGIGKTSLVKEFIFRHRDEFDAVLYLNYGGSLRRLITDDGAVRLNSISKITEESGEDYYLRKLNALKAAAEGKRVVAIIDNFDDFSDPCFKEILGVFRKVIFVTRNDSGALGYSAITISAMSENAALYSLFEHDLRRSLNSEELPFVENIIHKTSAHTLALELIAKQISCSFLSVEEASKLIDKYGFTHIAPEKIEFMRDDIYFNNTLQRVLSELFAVNKLTEKQIALLKIISLFGADGIDTRLLQKLCGMSSLDGVNLLIKYGWANSENGAVYLHSVIREMVYGLNFTQKSVGAVNVLMKNLYSELNSESDTAYLFKLTDRVLCESAKFPVLCGKNYARLCYLSLMKAPVDIENGILERAESLIGQSEYLSPREIMDMHSVIIDLHEADSDFYSAENALNRARSFAKRSFDNFILAQFYDMLADFYNKRYERGDIEKCLKSGDRAIHFAKRASGDNVDELLSSCALFKAVVMMRNHKGSAHEILSLLNLGGVICERSENKFTQVNYELQMSRAWYCALIKRDKEQIPKHLCRAYTIIKKIYSSDLAVVVHIILPAARMYYDTLDNKKAVELLNKGIDICCRHEELPYIRQQQEIEEILKGFTD